MELTNLLKFIPEYLLILVVVTYVLGIAFKKMEYVPDKYITLLLLIFSITFAILLCIINGQYKTMLEATVNAILQGILCWGVAVGINQTAKQIGKDE